MTKILLIRKTLECFDSPPNRDEAKWFLENHYTRPTVRVIEVSEPKKYEVIDNRNMGQPKRYEKYAVRFVLGIACEIERPDG